MLVRVRSFVLLVAYNFHVDVGWRDMSVKRVEVLFALVHLIACSRSSGRIRDIRVAFNSGIDNLRLR